MFLLKLLQLGHSQDIFKQLRSNRHKNKEVSSLLKNNVLGHSEAENVFRPCWDTLEDFPIYSLVILGVITVPTAIINGTLLDCNPCHDNHCQDMGKNFINNTTTPGFNLWSRTGLHRKGFLKSFPCWIKPGEVLQSSCKRKYS